jgi:hypothetical protein
MFSGLHSTGERTKKKETDIMANIIESQTQIDAPATEIVVQGNHYNSAFHATAAERAALKAERLIRLSFDVELAVDMVLAAVPRVAVLKEEILKLPLNHEQLGRLELYAHAVGYAQVLYTVATAPPAGLKPTYEEALQLRGLLHADAHNVARSGLVNADAVDAISTDIGYHNVGYSLMGLVSVFRQNASRVVGHTVSTITDWERADKLAARLLDLTARREKRREQRPRLADDRLRSLTLMVDSYEQMRRAVQFTRYDEGDAESIVPSIYTAKGKNPTREDTQETPDGESVTAPQAGQPAAPQPQTVNEQFPVVPIGAPGGNPFA